MAKYLTVSIPEPCREDWNKMSPDPTGRHCSSCEKSVVDFTLMSDSQVAEFFRKHNDKVCGRFYEDQLEREIAFPKKQMALLKYFFTVSIPAFLFSLKAGAQIKPIPPATEIMPTRGTLYGETVSNYRIVNGFVKDTAGLPVEGASIRIAGTNRGVSADTNGAFQLILSKADSILIISSVQAETKKFSVPVENNFTIIIQRRNFEELRGTLGIVVYTKTRKRHNTQKISTPPAALPEKIKDFTIFPNPIAANERLHISRKDKFTGDQLVEIFSAEGNRVQSEKIAPAGKDSEMSIILKTIPTGFYIVSITDLKTGQKISKEFVVQ